MNYSTSQRLLGYACLVCGLLLVTNGIIAEMLPHEPIVVNNVVSATALAGSLSGDLGALGFLFAFFALERMKAAGSGWLPKLGGVFILIGTVLGLIGSIYTLPDPNRIQYLTPSGSILVTLGWLVYGIGVVRTQVLKSWQRFVPLILGLFFFIQLPFQIIFYISVLGHPNYIIVVGGYGILIALVGSIVLWRMKHLIVSTP